MSETTATNVPEHRSVPLHISRGREGLYCQLVELADRLNCGRTDLLWDALEKYVQNPPTTAPVGASSPRSGSAKGFWLVHELNDKGRVSAIRIIEVQSRGDYEGKAFFRYKDEKERNRALRQCERAALYDAQITGIKVPSEGFDIEEVVYEEVDGSATK